MTTAMTCTTTPADTAPQRGQSPRAPLPGEAPRPVALGYLALPTHARPDDATAAVRDWARRFAAVAQDEGYALEGIFTDVRGQTEHGLYALVEAVSRGVAVAVIAPDLTHLQHAGCLSGADLHTAARYLRARILTVDSPPGVGDPPGA